MIVGQHSQQRLVVLYSDYLQRWTIGGRHQGVGMERMGRRRVGERRIARRSVGDWSIGRRGVRVVLVKVTGKGRVIPPSGVPQTLEKSLRIVNRVLCNKVNVSPDGDF